MKPVLRIHRIAPVLTAILLLLASCRPEPLIRSVVAGTPPAGTVSARWLAATVAWHDEVSDITAAVASAAISGGADAGPVTIMPLDRLALPRKIVTVDGLLPGEPGYPLVEWTVELHPRTGRPFNGRNRSGSVEAPGRSVQPDSPSFSRIAAVGDIMPGRGFDTLLQSDNGEADALGDVLPLLEQPDLLIGNLETAVTGYGEAVAKSYNFKVPPETLDALTALGFDYYHLANNHGWDYGEQGFLDTLAALDATGVGYSGAGTDLESSRFAWETTLGDTGIQILSLGAYYAERNGFDGRSRAAAGTAKPGVLWDSPENESFIRSTLGRNAVLSIVVVHGGYEWESVPRKDVKELYRRYVDWGADIVVAHHPHVLQGMELYRGVPIAYSLGNFIFPGMKGWYTGEETGVLEFLVYQGRVVGIDFHPVRIDDVRLRRAEGQDIDTRFWLMSRELGETG